MLWFDYLLRNVLDHGLLAAGPVGFDVILRNALDHSQMMAYSLACRPD